MTNANDILRIDTPENVTFDYEVAGIGSRFLAALVDTVLLVLLQVIVLGTLIFIGLRRQDLFSLDDGPTWILAVLSLIAFVFFWGYYIFFEILWNGQTPGKRWVGLRVIRLDGTPVTTAEVVIRNLVRTIDLLPAAYGVGVISMFVNQNSRRLGDLAAGTVVVHEGTTSSLKDLTANRRGALVTLVTDSAIPAGFPLERLTGQDLQIIEQFLLRRSHLANRRQLARHILRSLYERVGQPTETILSEDSEGMLAAFYQVLKERIPQ
jgi:uncharacterized RDD family membrane protein YckC